MNIEFEKLRINSKNQRIKSNEKGVQTGEEFIGTHLRNQIKTDRGKLIKIPTGIKIKKYLESKRKKEQKKRRS